MSYILPSYVLKLPNALTRHIGTFLTHPDMQARKYRTLTIAAKMRHDLKDRIIEITCSPSLTALYKRPGSRPRYQSMVEVHDMLVKFRKTPLVNIDTMMRTCMTSYIKAHRFFWKMAMCLEDLHFRQNELFTNQLARRTGKHTVRLLERIHDPNSC